MRERGKQLVLARVVAVAVAYLDGVVVAISKNGGHEALHVAVANAAHGGPNDNTAGAGFDSGKVRQHNIMFLQL